MQLAVSVGTRAPQFQTRPHYKYLSPATGARKDGTPDWLQTRQSYMEYSEMKRSLALASTATLAILSAASVAGAAERGGFGDLVAKVAPSVVYVEVDTTVTPAAAPGDMQNFFEQFRRQYGDRFPIPDMPDMNSQDQPVQHGLGSGFIVSTDGEIVTNNHVIENADNITVKLADGRSFPATVVGADKLTDIALLRIDTGETLPAVTFGESDTLRPGDTVIAMGSPFGLGGTVTSGIVSAMSRDIHSGPYDDFIQTDAAINRGNSGGPLFDDQGDVVGVNTAIFSPGGGSVGIGFAVPSDLVQKVVADLGDDGKIERGWLGVQIKPMSDEVAQALGYDTPKGAVVDQVFDGSPAAAAKFRGGDIIVKFGDHEIVDPRDLTRAVANLAPGTEEEVKVLRGGKEVTLDVTLALRSDEKA